MVRRWGDGEEVGPDSGKCQVGRQCQGGETLTRWGDSDEVGRQRGGEETTRSWGDCEEVGGQRRWHWVDCFWLRKQSSYLHFLALKVFYCGLD